MLHDLASMRSAHSTQCLRACTYAYLNGGGSETKQRERWKIILRWGAEVTGCCTPEFHLDKCSLAGWQSPNPPQFERTFPKEHTRSAVYEYSTHENQHICCRSLISMWLVGYYFELPTKMSINFSTKIGHCCSPCNALWSGMCGLFCCWGKRAMEYGTEDLERTGMDWMYEFSSSFNCSLMHQKWWQYLHYRERTSSGARCNSFSANRTAMKEH